MDFNGSRKIACRAPKLRKSTQKPLEEKENKTKKWKKKEKGRNKLPKAKNQRKAEAKREQRKKERGNIPIENKESSKSRGFLL